MEKYTWKCLSQPFPLRGMFLLFFNFCFLFLMAVSPSLFKIQDNHVSPRCHLYLEFSKSKPPRQWLQCQPFLGEKKCTGTWINTGNKSVNGGVILNQLPLWVTHMDFHQKSPRSQWRRIPQRKDFFFMQSPGKGAPHRAEHHFLIEFLSHWAVLRKTQWRHIVTHGSIWKLCPEMVREGRRVKL